MSVYKHAARTCQSLCDNLPDRRSVASKCMLGLDPTPHLTSMAGDNRQGWDWMRYKPPLAERECLAHMSHDLSISSRMLDG